jgi:hypothetical protein
MTRWKKLPNTDGPPLIVAALRGAVPPRSCVAYEPCAQSCSHGNRALTEDAVRAIKASLVSGVAGNVLARRYGVHASTISRIKCGTRYLEVPPRVDQP